MRIFASTTCLKNYKSLRSLIKDMINGGLDAIELSASPVVTQDDLIYLTKSGAVFQIHNYFPPQNPPFVLNLASVNPDDHANSLKMVRAAIDLCNRLGSSVYGVHSGYRARVEPSSLDSIFKYEEIAPYETAYNQLKGSLQTSCDYAAQFGVSIFVENHLITRSNLVDGKNDLSLGCEARELVNLIQDTSRPNIGILLDSGHLNVAAKTLGFDRINFIDRVKPFIRAFHVHDNDGVSDLHQPLTVKSWILEIIRDPSFSESRIVVEAKFENVKDLAEHVTWLKQELTT